MAALTAGDGCGRTALHYCAATNHQTTIVDLLLRHWTRQNIEGNSDASGALLEVRDFDGLTALAHAVIAGNHVIVEHLLMTTRADVSCRDNQRHTVMHLATGHYCHIV